MIGYFVHLAILLGIYLILALALQLVLGYGGLLNLGHIAFFAIGGYTTALLALAGFPFFLTIIASGVLAGFFGFLLAVPANKFKGDYLALATLAFSLVVYAISLNWVSLTNGPRGLPGIPRPIIFGFQFSSNLSFLFLVGFFFLVSLFFIKRVVESPFGRTLEAIRDNELMARVLGERAFRVKSISLAISAFFAGIAGSFYSYYMSFIEPNSFNLMQIVPLITIVIIGGFASLKGTVIATIILILLPEPLRFIGLPSFILGPLREIIYSILLLLILVYKPNGFFGRVKLE